MEDQQTTHPYFTDKARTALTAVGFDPDRCAELAAWAQRVRAADPDQQPAGVVVAADGEILATTVRAGHAVYVDDDGTRRWGLFGNEVGLALGQIRRQRGPLAYFKTSEVTRGAGRPALRTPPTP